tara:strand:+ start:239 stop:487 length:249 start_codon:yes stop_codon:yes gene_type:complete
MKTNYGTAITTLIVNYKEMLELIIQARIGNDRIDEWKKAVDLVENPEQVRSRLPKEINCQAIIDGTFKFDDDGGNKYYEKYL